MHQSIRLLCIRLTPTSVSRHVPCQVRGEHDSGVVLYISLRRLTSQNVQQLRDLNDKTVRQTLSTNARARGQRKKFTSCFLIWRHAQGSHNYRLGARRVRQDVRALADHRLREGRSVQTLVPNCLSARHTTHCVHLYLLDLPCDRFVTCINYLL